MISLPRFSILSCGNSSHFLLYESMQPNHTFWIHKNIYGGCVSGHQNHNCSVSHMLNLLYIVHIKTMILHKRKTIKTVNPCLKPYRPTFVLDSSIST